MEPALDFEVDDRIDITDRTCPMTFVMTRLKLEEMEPGQVLEVTLEEGEPMRNVPRTLKEHGHLILKVVQLEGGRYRLYVRRGD